jgi:phage terminase small subunit
MALNDKQQRFVDEYLKDLNATQAAIRAGYSAKTAYAIAEKLLRKAEIQQAVQDAKKARSKRTEHHSRPSSSRACAPCFL